MKTYLVTPLLGNRNNSITFGKNYSVEQKEFSRGMEWVYIINDNNVFCWYYANGFQEV